MIARCSLYLLGIVCLDVQLRDEERNPIPTMLPADPPPAFAFTSNTMSVGTNVAEAGLT